MTSTSNIGTSSTGELRSSLRERKKDATRHAIEDAAWELFQERGYAATSVNDIADRAMVAPRTFFRYYPSKEAVLYPEFDDAVCRVREVFAARPASEPVITSLLVALESMAPCVAPDADRVDRFQVLKGAAPDSVGEYFRGRIAETVRELVLTREADRPDAELRADLAAGILQLVMDTTRAQWRQTGDHQLMREVGRHCVALLGELLGRPSSVGPADA